MPNHSYWTIPQKGNSFILLADDEFLLLDGHSKKRHPVEFVIRIRPQSQKVRNARWHLQTDQSKWPRHSWQRSQWQVMLDSNVIQKSKMRDGIFQKSTRLETYKSKRHHRQHFWMDLVLGWTLKGSLNDPGIFSTKTQILQSRCYPPANKYAR